jgi:hypothetical protein
MVVYLASGPKGLLLPAPVSPMVDIDVELEDLGFFSFGPSVEDVEASSQSLQSCLQNYSM